MTSLHDDGVSKARLLIINNRQGKLKEWSVCEYGRSNPLWFSPSENICKVIQNMWNKAVKPNHIFVELINDDCHVCYKPIGHIPTNHYDATNHYVGAFSVAQMKNLSNGKITYKELVASIK